MTWAVFPGEWKESQYLKGKGSRTIIETDPIEVNHWRT